MNYIVSAAAVLLAAIIIFIGIKHRRYLAPLLALVQTAALVVFEMTGGGGIECKNDFHFDRLSIIFAILIGVTAILACAQSIGYLGRFHQRNPEIKSRRGVFLLALFVAVVAALGIVVSNNIVWMYLFWEILTISSFELLRYGDKAETEKRAFRALNANLLGGMAFVTGILILGQVFGALELDVMLRIGSLYGDMVAVPAVFLVLTGLIMAVQLPFSDWLVSSRIFVSPALTAVSASLTVNAGIFIIIRMAPVLGMSNFAGIMTMVVGGLSFVTAAFLAILQTDIEKVTAYSTISMMGLIVACCGIGSTEAVMAGIVLTVFHAVAKSLLLACIGFAGVDDGTWDEDGDTDERAVFAGRPRLAACMLTGFGVLLAAALQLVILSCDSAASFADSGNIILITILCFGGGATICYMVKALGNLAMMSALPTAEGEKVEKSVKCLVALSVLLCIGFPVMMIWGVEPYLEDAFGGLSSTMGMEACFKNVVVIAFVALLSGVFYGKGTRYVPADAEDIERLTIHDRRFGPGGLIDEKKIWIAGFVAASVIIVLGLGFMIGTLVNLLGGAA